MKIVVLKKSQRTHSRMCPWLIDTPSESNEKN
jgi:hypothetical protein